MWLLHLFDSTVLASPHKQERSQCLAKCTLPSFAWITPHFSWFHFWTVSCTVSHFLPFFSEVQLLVPCWENACVPPSPWCHLLFLSLGVCFHSPEDILLRVHRLSGLWTGYFLGLLHNSCTEILFSCNIWGNFSFLSLTSSFLGFYPHIPGVHFQKGCTRDKLSESP